MSTKLKLIVNNPELLPDEFLDEVLSYYNRPVPMDKSAIHEGDLKRIARWFGNGLCNSAS